jgi:NADPH:quinone reductase-like Zn-dependent oxidoreductase
MLAVRYHGFGGPDRLMVEQLPPPEAASGEVVVRVVRAGVSPLDDKIRAGVLPPGMLKALPLVPGASAVGVVEAPGSGGLDAGTRVALCGWGYGVSRDGTWRESIAVPPGHLVPIPDGVDDDAAGGLVAGAGYLTAWLALTRLAPLRPGQVLLAPGAYGAVAHAAGQVARLLDAGQVISTVRGAARAAAARAAAPGIEIIDLDAESLGAGVARLTSGGGVDVVLDGLGGEITGQALGALARGGVLVSIGYTAGQQARIAVTDLIWKTAQIKGFLFSLFTQPDLVEACRTLLGHLAAGELKPAVDRVYPLEQAVEAQRYVIEARPPGRVLLAPTRTASDMGDSR